MSVQCQDLAADRAIGDYWERQFCKLAASTGRSFTPHQIGRPKSAVAAYRHEGKWNTATLPDVTIWTSPGEHDEIKHKDPSRNLEFGLERYRVEALVWFAEETAQAVHYTIHNYGLVPLPTRKERKGYRENDIAHWVTAPILDLVSSPYRIDPNGTSWVNGVPRRGVETWFWRVEMFDPLTYRWGLIERPQHAPLLQERLL